MFVLPDLVESALTPELGGVFQDLRLRVRPYLFEERRKEALAALSVGTAGAVAVDFVSSFERDVGAFKRLVIGWENIPTEFSAANLDRLVAQCAGQSVGVEGANDLALLQYVLKFAGDTANFTGESTVQQEKKS
jgi:hypothetical protein